MFDFTQGTQARAWLFKSEAELAQLRSRAQQLAKEGILEGAEPVPRSFASRLAKPGVDGGGGASSTVKSGVKRPRPPDADPSAAGGQTAVPSAGDLEAVSPSDEAALLRYFVYMIQDSCGQRSESIKRGPHVQATATGYLRRFFLSNSMLDFDPKVVMMASMFLAGKIEYEYIRLAELKDVFGEKFGKAIIDFEGRLLQGLGFHLKTFHPYNPFFGLVNGLEHVNRVKKLGVSPQDLQRLVAAGQDAIDLLMPTDLPLLYPPARIALAVLLRVAGDLGLTAPVEAYLEYCFEEEDEHGDIMADVDKILPVLEEEMKNAPADLEARKQSQAELVKESMARLKKCARWGGKPKGGRKKSKASSSAAGGGGGGGGSGGDAGSVASVGEATVGSAGGGEK